MAKAHGRYQIIGINEVARARLGDSARLLRRLKPLARIDRADRAFQGVHARQIDDRNHTIVLQIDGVLVLTGADQRNPRNKPSGGVCFSELAAICARKIEFFDANSKVFS